MVWEKARAGVMEKTHGLYPAPLRILKAGHHGSRTSTTPAFLDAVRPSAARLSESRTV